MSQRSLLFGSPDPNSLNGTNASVNKCICRGGMLMRKLFSAIKKVIHNTRLSITIKLPLVNVTLAHSLITQLSL